MDVVRWRDDVADEGDATEVAPPGLVVVGWIGAGAPGPRAGLGEVGSPYGEGLDWAWGSEAADESRVRLRMEI